MVYKLDYVNNVNLELIIINLIVKNVLVVQLVRIIQILEAIREIRLTASVCVQPVILDCIRLKDRLCVQYAQLVHIMPMIRLMDLGFTLLVKNAALVIIQTPVNPPVRVVQLEILQASKVHLRVRLVYQGHINRGSVDLVVHVQLEVIQTPVHPPVRIVQLEQLQVL